MKSCLDNHCASGACHVGGVAVDFVEVQCRDTNDYCTYKFPIYSKLHTKIMRIRFKVIENTHYATWNVPFPAITICNMNKISSEAAAQVAAQMYTTTPSTDQIDK